MKQLNAFAYAIVIGIPLLLLALALGPRNWPWDNAAALQKTRSDLSLAESRWKSYAIQDYNITVMTNIPGCAGFTPQLLQVRHGQLVMTEELRQQEYCHFNKFIPSQAFVFVQEEIERSNPWQSYLSVEFDSIYGFISRYHADCNNSAVNCIVTYRFDNFKPINP